MKMVVDMAKTEANRLGDEYISTEHLFLAILAERGTQLARTLEEFGINRTNVLGVIQELRADHAQLNVENSRDVTRPWKNTLIT